MKENKQGKEAVYSQRVKAGRRTYFFDIKSNRVNDFYLTITESKKRNPEDTFYEKQKLFLYPKQWGHPVYINISLTDKSVLKVVPFGLDMWKTDVVVV